jgi:hypothetical protein
LDVLDKRNKLSIIKMQITCRGSELERASREIDNLQPHLTEQAADRSRWRISRWRRRSAGAVFFNQVQLHCELADLSLEYRDVRFIFSDGARFGFFVIEFAAIKLRQPQLDEVRRDHCWVTSQWKSTHCQSQE